MVILGKGGGESVVELRGSHLLYLFRTARCVKMLGKGVVKVVHRCDAAKENNELGIEG